MLEFYGVFSNYEIEDVYNFIGKHKIENRLKELEGIPTMGTTLYDFISKDIMFPGVGIIEVFNMILGYFPNDLDLAVFLYNKSINYNEENYFSTEKQKLERKKYTESIQLMIERGEDVEYYKAKLNSPFWLEMHFFYMNLMKLFVKKLNEKKVLNFKIEGIYLIEKNKLIRDNIILEIKKRRSPGVGSYLSVKSAPELNRIWFDLEMNTNANNVEYKFKKNSFYYLLKLNSKEASIEEFSGSFTEGELRLIDTDVELVSREMTRNYINNFNSISNMVFIDFRQKLSNGFLSYASSFFDEEDELIINLISLNNSQNHIWNKY